jgi:hypothetical protein
VEPRSWEHEILTQALVALDRADAEVASLIDALDGRDGKP